MFKYGEHNIKTGQHLKKLEMPACQEDSQGGRFGGKGALSEGKMGILTVLLLLACLSNDQVYF